MRAIVIGAGIGGLSAAVALKKAGIDCTVFEAVKEIRPVGAAISIWPNGCLLYTSDAADEEDSVDLG
ncbi:NAD(P)-binding protein, partial [Enterobacter asburiae]|uniref:NAD(P)-binding protein n=1 Tax=Enterobacter asburiae TaxID=61645 RepID=UPI0004A31204